MDAIWLAQFGFATALANALLHSLWQCALVAGVSSLFLRAFDRHSAALRHVIGMLFLVLMLVLPALTFFSFWQFAPNQTPFATLAPLKQTVDTTRPEVLVQQLNISTVALSVIWLLGVAFMTLRHASALLLLARLDKSPPSALPKAYQQSTDALRAALGIARYVNTRLSDQVLTPFTARLIRPIIWLPASLLATLPRDQVLALLAHELAHVKRLDWLWNSVQCAIESVLFFHPAVWWLSKRVREEREQACDELAVAAGTDAICLAETLGALASARLDTTAPTLVLASQGGSLMKRISRLLSDTPTHGRWWAPFALAIALVTTTALAIQVAPSANQVTQMHIESKGDMSKIGDYKRVSAVGLDKQRDLLIQVRTDGRIAVNYQEDGKPHPLDAQALAWLDEMARLGAPTPPQPPAAPSAPAEPAAPSPPTPPPAPSVLDDLTVPAYPSAPTMVAPPAPSAPPLLSDSVEFQSIMRLIAADPRVQRLAGSSIKPSEATGHLHITNNVESTGSANLTMNVEGHNGRAQLRLNARRDNGVWSIESLEVRPNTTR